MCEGRNVDNAGFLVRRRPCTYNKTRKKTLGKDVMSDDVRSKLKIIAIGGELLNVRREDSAIVEENMEFALI
jgi:hypothetical protein